MGIALWLTEHMQGACDPPEDGPGREVGGRWEGEDLGAPMADSSWCLTENHKIL